MRNVVIGTAGHIDHGKTALVRALTGIDTDRLAEEKRRGISIDLGFAHLDLDAGLHVGFVDVPGHERFVKNMLAGVGGIDLVLLVVAAEESIKPQTREHFDICRLLGIRAGIIALTKADLVDADILGLVRLEVEEFVAGSFLDGAPIVPVSSATGQGLVELRAQIARLADTVPERDATAHFRLPIDRAFSMRGFGAVVTGTLVAGVVAREQELQVHPDGRSVRVRGIQVHGGDTERASAGQRTALNLAGVDAADLTRGMVLAEPDRFRPTRQVDCTLDLLESAAPLKHRAPVHFHAGTAEVEAEVRLIESDILRPGGHALARIHLHDPILMLPGDRFIIRKFSPVVTIGGGTALDIDPPRRLRRAASAARLRILAAGNNPDRVALLVRESAYGLGLPELVARTGLRPADIEAAAKSVGLLLLSEPQPRLLDRAWVERKIAAITKLLETFHRQNPLLPGYPKEELRSREFAGAPPTLLDAVLSCSPALIAGAETVRLNTHSLHLREDEEVAVARIEGLFRDAGLAVPPTLEVLAKSGVETARAKSLLQILLRDKRLVRVGLDLVFHGTAIQALRDMLKLRKGQRFSVPEFKDWTGVSRKYAIPLLEFLDRERVTRREGDSRIVL